MIKAKIAFYRGDLDQAIRLLEEVTSKTHSIDYVGFISFTTIGENEIMRLRVIKEVISALDSEELNINGLLRELKWIRGAGNSVRGWIEESSIEYIKAIANIIERHAIGVAASALLAALDPNYYDGILEPLWNEYERLNPEIRLALAVLLYSIIELLKISLSYKDREFKEVADKAKRILEESMVKRRLKSVA